MFEQIAITQLFAMLLVFCRVGSGIMILPGIGESYVMPRARLLLALAVSLVMVPVLQPLMPPMPATPAGLLVAVVSEIAIGLFLGVICRIMIATIHIAGQVISMQSSLSTAMMFDMTQSGQGTTIGNLLSVFAVVLLFATDMHHVMLTGFYESYRTFAPGTMLPMSDIANLSARAMTDSFTMATKISAPFVIGGLLLNLIAGILSRLMPNLQVFFLLMPPQIMLSFLLMMVAFSSMMLWYLNYVEQSLTLFLRLG